MLILVMLTNRNFSEKVFHFHVYSSRELNCSDFLKIFFFLAVINFLPLLIAYVSIHFILIVNNNAYSMFFIFVVI